MKNAFCSIPILIFALSACELVIDPDLPEHTPRLVVKAFFTPDSRWVVSVGRSIGILESLPGGESLVADATVALLSGDRVIDHLTFLQRQRVYVSETPLQAGESYALRVSAPGFETVRATDTIPGPVPTSIVSHRIETSDLMSDLLDLAPGELAVSDFSIRLRIQDPPGEKNHYQIRMIAPARSGERDLYFSTRDPSIIADNRIEDPVIDGVEAFSGTAPFFKDALFDGQAHEIELSYAEGVVLASRERLLRVQVLYVSETYYKHLRSALLHEHTQENPFAEPVNIYSNVENGYGVFAGYSSQTFELAFE